MKPVGHVAISGVISIFVGYFFRSIPAGLASFLTGTLIDFDHYFDYYANHHFTLSLRKVYTASEATDFKRLYLLLHSYELVAILWIACLALSLGPVWKGIAIGLTQHMIVDQITNRMSFRGYFLTYRIIKDFKKEHLVK